MMDELDEFVKERMMKSGLNISLSLFASTAGAVIPGSMQ